MMRGFSLHLSVQCVPYLIAIGTDPEATMRNKADQQLVEIDKKYTGFIHVSRDRVVQESIAQPDQSVTLVLVSFSDEGSSRDEDVLHSAEGHRYVP